MVWVSVCFSFPPYLTWERSKNDLKFALSETKKNHQLPDSFATVPVVALKTAMVLVPLQSGASSPKEGQLAGAILKEKCWLDHAIQLLEKEIENGDTVTWSAFHASLQGASADLPTTLTQLLPEKAAMIKHGMNMVHVQLATEFLNPGQVAVVAFDAPL